jgi:hypothetical protein
VCAGGGGGGGGTLYLFYFLYIISFLYLTFSLDTETVILTVCGVIWMSRATPTAPQIQKKKISLDGDSHFDSLRCGLEEEEELWMSEILPSQRPSIFTM